MIKRGTKLNNRWTVGQKIGEGSCGEVYTAEEVDPEIGSLVIKLCRIPTGNRSLSDREQSRLLGTLDWERNLYLNRLRNFRYSPSLPLRYGYGSDHGYRYIIVQKLDFDLTKLVQRRSSVPHAEVARIGREILSGLELLHGMGFLFVDMKPDNFMIQQETQEHSSGPYRFQPADRLYFVDFGLAAKYSNYEGADRVRNRVVGRVNGTPSFLSLDALDGWSETHKDDVESLGYILLYLCGGGKLPWDDASCDADILTAKRTMDLSVLTRRMGCPEVGKFILAARALRPEELPDYDSFRALMGSLEQRPDSGGEVAVVGDNQRGRKGDWQYKEKGKGKRPAKRVRGDSEEGVEDVGEGNEPARRRSPRPTRNKTEQGASSAKRTRHVRGTKTGPDDVGTIDQTQCNDGDVARGPFSAAVDLKTAPQYGRRAARWSAGQREAVAASAPRAESGTHLPQVSQHHGNSLERQVSRGHALISLEGDVEDENPAEAGPFSHSMTPNCTIS